MELKIATDILNRLARLGAPRLEAFGMPVIVSGDMPPGEMWLVGERGQVVMLRHIESWQDAAEKHMTGVDSNAAESATASTNPERCEGQQFEWRCPHGTNAAGAATFAAGQSVDSLTRHLGTDGPHHVEADWVAPAETSAAEPDTPATDEQIAEWEWSFEPMSLRDRMLIARVKADADLLAKLRAVIQDQCETYHALHDEQARLRARVDELLGANTREVEARRAMRHERDMAQRKLTDVTHEESRLQRQLDEAHARCRELAARACPDCGWPKRAVTVPVPSCSGAGRCELHGVDHGHPEPDVTPLPDYLCGAKMIVECEEPKPCAVHPHKASAPFTAKTTGEFTLTLDPRAPKPQGYKNT